MGINIRSIDSVGELRYDSRWTWDHEGTPQNRKLLLWLIAGGAGSLCVGRRRYKLKPGLCIVTSLDQTHIGRQHQKRLLHIPWIVFRADEGGDERLPTLADTARMVEEMPVLSGLMRRAIEDHVAGNREESCQWLHAALREVRRQNRRFAHGSIPRDRVREIHTLMEEIRLAPEINRTPEEFAERFHCSPDHFTRMFRAVAGVCPRDYMIRCRIEAAKTYLRFTDLQVGEIAERLGYGDIYFFSRQFSRWAGESPVRYRCGGSGTR